MLYKRIENWVDYSSYGLYEVYYRHVDKGGFLTTLSDEFACELLI
jgi:hypothetical protein